MSQNPLPTKDRLIRAASALFRRKGYNGVGVAELLDAAEAPKGSLYHHFPNGKSDLALAAATWASDGMLRIIAASFEDAPDFGHGVQTFCHKLAKLFDQSGRVEGCPVTATLLDGPENPEFRAHAQHLIDGWIDEATTHALRFGMGPQTAQATSEQLLILIQGGWMLARARGSSDVLRSLPARLVIPVDAGDPPA